MKKPTKKLPKKPIKKVVKAKILKVVKAEVQQVALAINPVEEALAEVASPAEQVLQKAQALTITDSASATVASEMLVQLKTVSTLIEAKRKALTKPLKDEAKRIESQFRPSAEAIEKADALLREKMISYRQQLEAKATEARKALIAQAEEAAASGDQNAALALTQQAMSQDSGLSNKTVAADGSVGVRMVWDFEVEDMAKVPPEYFVLDEGRVRAAVRSGVRDIAGIRIFQREQLAVSAAA